MGVTYPYWWQYWAWLLITGPWTRGRDDARPETGHVPSKVQLLVLRRDSGGVWTRSASHAYQQDALISNLTETGKFGHVTVVGTLGRHTVSIRRLKHDLIETKANCLLVLDPLSIGGVGLLGLAKAHRLGRYLSKRSIPAVVVSWDALDPQQAMVTRFLTRVGGSSALGLGSGPDVLSFMGVKCASAGPAPEAAIIRTDFESAPKRNLQPRPFDVYVPAPGDPDRDPLVAEFTASCAERNLTVLHGSNNASYDEYLNMLSECKAVFIVNAVRRDFLRFSRLKGTPSKHHLVGRNSEAVMAGCIPLSQTCPELASTFPDCSPFSWTSPTEAASILKDALGAADLSQERVDTSRRRLSKRVHEQPGISRCISQLTTGTQHRH